MPIHTLYCQNSDSRPAGLMTRCYVVKPFAMGRPLWWHENTNQCFRHRFLINCATFIVYSHQSEWLEIPASILDRDRDLCLCYQVNDVSGTYPTITAKPVAQDIVTEREIGDLSSSSAEAKNLWILSATPLWLISGKLLLHSAYYVHSDETIANNFTLFNIEFFR